MENKMFDKITPPEGSRIECKDGMLSVPNNPIVVLIEGDGIGETVGKVPGITACAVRVIDAAVAKAYGGKRKIAWLKAHAGDSARSVYHPDVKDKDIASLSAEKQRELYIPEDTLNAIKHYGVALKGPLTTPIGGGFRSINVFLRKHFDLYSCVRPVKYFEGVQAPNIHANKVNMVIFRENVEDVYAGIEYNHDSDQAKKLRAFLENEFGVEFAHPDWAYSIGIKPMSDHGTKRLVRRAIRYAQDHGMKHVTLVHKGNIMKFTEGNFRNWGYELAKDEFGDSVVAESDVTKDTPKDAIIINDRIADSMLQQIQTRPAEYDVIACPNLNGDYLSDALAALVGGLGLAPGANIGDNCAIFEATHGTAPKYRGKDKANPGSVLLSGALMLEHLGWKEAAQLVHTALSAVISTSAQRAQNNEKPLLVTYDLARQFEGYGESDGLSCSAFTEELISRL